MIMVQKTKGLECPSPFGPAHSNTCMQAFKSSLHWEGSNALLFLGFVHLAAKAEQISVILRCSSESLRAVANAPPDQRRLWRVSTISHY
jgi:hypothetical protein